MSYTPNTWATGDTITAAKLNNMEQGIANAGGVLQVRENNGVLDKTWKEITDAGFSVLIGSAGEYQLYLGGFSEDGDYGVSYWTFNMTEPSIYIADSQNGYPVYGE